MAAGTLYLVATPIGNLEDVTLRALRALREAARIYAEDTRRTRTLLERHGIRAAVRSLHAHNEASRAPEVLAELAAGGDVALVSDAGTPLLSDPGERLVAAALAAGHAVHPVPGASAVLSALVGSGLAPVPFAFHGFPPRRAGERRALFASLAERPETQLFFESPRRIGATLAELARAFGPERRACVARELTKLHETFERDALGELAGRFAGGAKGEVTLVVAGAAAREAPAAADLDAALRAALAGGASARDAAREVAERLGVPRREAYARATALRASPRAERRTR
ncbi:MAG TPA: 16S rRNA (cytidine(1402)-2'-O)-methyltransferase [Myxococcota bacterium]|nr:16S rRNA (cytidine(1402)-2'-O)-methyltransferase [Myxococcota bacterium]